jgi:hypothetical protein
MHFGRPIVRCSFASVIFAIFNILKGRLNFSILAQEGRHAQRGPSGGRPSALSACSFNIAFTNILKRRLTLSLSGEGGRPNAQRGHPGGRDEARPAGSRGRDHAHHCARHKRRHPTEAAERHPATSRESLDPLRSLVLLRPVLIGFFLDFVSFLPFLCSPQATRPNRSSKASFSSF